MYAQTKVPQYVRDGFEIVRTQLLSPTEDEDDQFNSRLREVMDRDEIKLLGIELLLRLSEIDHRKLFPYSSSNIKH